jgi:hypothetical protein
LRSKIECYVLSGLLILMPAISPGCGGRDRSVSREVIDGVEIVENGDGIYPGRGEPRALSSVRNSGSTLKTNCSLRPG